MLTSQRSKQGQLTETNVLYFQALLVELLLTDFMPMGRYSNTFYTFNSFVNMLGAINSSVNFFFYCALGSRYRASLQSLCCRRKKTRSDRSASDSGQVTVGLWTKKVRQFSPMQWTYRLFISGLDYILTGQLWCYYQAAWSTQYFVGQCHPVFNCHNTQIAGLA